MTKANANAGFTLIELIVVIVLVGILSAAALPKYFNFTQDARISSLQAARGALQSTAAMAHGKFVMTGSSLHFVEGSLLTLTDNQSGYPRADAGFAAVAGLTSGNYALTFTATSLTVQLVSAAPNANCSLEYAEPVSAGSAPTYMLITSGC